MTVSRWSRVLFDIMREHRVSVREMARLSGLSRTTIRRAISGETSLRIDDLELCLALFGLELDAHPIPIEEDV